MKIGALKFALSIFAFGIMSCGSLKPLENVSKISAAKEIEGEYKNMSLNDSVHAYQNLKTIIDYQNTSGMTEVETVEIKILSEKELQFIFIDNQKNRFDYRSRYRIDNGTVYLKNRNFRLTGIPYLFGGYKIHKAELTKNYNANLILNAVHIDEGAFLFIFPASIPRSYYQNTYEKISPSANAR